MIKFRQINFKISELLFVIRNTFNHGIIISTLGSSVTKGTGATSFTRIWSYLLYKEIGKMAPCKLFNNGFGGYTSGSIIAEKKYEYLLKQNPDILIFELCLLNNHSQGETVQKTLSDIDFINKFIHQKLPNTKIILIPSIPSPKELNTIKYGTTYEQFVKLFIDKIVKTDYTFIDFWDLFMSNINKNKINLQECFIDGIHPNNIGYKIWFESMKAKLIYYCLNK